MVLKSGTGRADDDLVRLGALLNGAESTRASVVAFEDLVLDTRTYSVRRGARPVELTPTEFRLLELFLSNPSEVLRRRDIVTRVWGYDFGPTSNVLNVYVGYLRRKLEAGGEPRLLHTVRGIGYMLGESAPRPRRSLIEFFANS